ncbi:response regulator [Pseudomonas putida CSV86]|uniref:Response regulator n=1 Tax=Pseudomonas bharatica CSV86 TaxID=1005395 RepID=A0A7K4EKE4_9PSED|nr:MULTISPECIES: response regulator [Pseudomonas]MDG9885175.1 response regulator [Pseudomonas sp. GD04058]NNJ18153.1 response regulator [Pseudomonas bharatica CSV86]
MDQQSMRHFIVGALQNEFEIATFSNGAQGLREALKKKYDLVIVDSELFGMSAVDTLYNFRKAHSSMPSIFLFSEGRQADARKSDANKALLKPVTSEALLTAVKNLLV